jgi:hypothetical protein
MKNLFFLAAVMPSLLLASGAPALSDADLAKTQAWFRVRDIGALEQWRQNYSSELLSDWINRGNLRGKTLMQLVVEHQPVTLESLQLFEFLARNGTNRRLRDQDGTSVESLINQRGKVHFLSIARNPATVSDNQLEVAARAWARMQESAAAHASAPQPAPQNAVPRQQPAVGSPSQNPKGKQLSDYVTMKNVLVGFAGLSVFILVYRMAAGDKVKDTKDPKESAGSMES